MRLKLCGPVPRGAWLGYMGVAGDPDGKTLDMIDSAEAMLLESARPRGVYRIVPSEALRTDGASAERCLRGCGAAAVMAVTLGVETDMLIDRMSAGNMTMALVLDCGASVLTEMAAAEMERIIRNGLEKEEGSGGACLRRRFCPGYGDSDIGLHRRLLCIVDGERKAGITLNESSMLMPRKSMTAFMGISESRGDGMERTCGECVLRRDCAYRREGRYCGDRF